MALKKRSPSLRICLHKVIVFLCYFVTCAYSSINMTEYYQMPPIYHLHEFDLCLNKNSDITSLYCIARTKIKPDPNSEIWNYIHKYSSDKKVNFQHDVLDRGVCINLCAELLEKLSAEEEEQLYQEEFAPMRTLPAEYYPNSLKYRQEYGRLVNKCVNLEMRNQYNLSAYSIIESCVSNDAEQRAYDWVDKLSLLVIAGILTLVIMSTTYDCKLKKRDSQDHFQNRNIEKVNMLWLSFSIPRNWKTLNIVKTDDLSKELQFIQGIRFIGAVIVIFAHTLFVNHVLPVSNIESIEEFFSYNIVVVVDGVRCYFVLGAFIFTIQFLEGHKTKPIRCTWINFRNGIVNRYIRLTPAFAFTILMHASLLSKLGDGPVWNRFVDSERAMCRSTWWLNLLYLNNYFKSDEPCVQQGWYLNTDFQLYTVGLLFLFLFIIRPKLSMFMMSLTLIGSVILIAVSTYVREFEGIMLIRLESMRWIMWFDEYYQHNYIPLHMNIGNYFIGIFAGIIYHKLRHSKTNIFDYWCMRVLYRIAAVFLIAMMSLSTIFYKYDFEKPALWIALFATGSRHLWGFFFAILLLGLSHARDSSIKRFFAHPVFVPLGKLSYGLFLIHLFTIKLIPKSIRGVGYFDLFAILNLFLTNLFLSMILAIIFCIFIEIPSIAVYENWRRNMRSRPQQENHMD